MADLKKFEEMLERLINEDKAGAEELFHEIVVEKSREIYENLLSEEEDEEVEETSDEEVEEGSDEEVDEASDDEDLEEDFNLDEFEVEADPMGGDATDDMMADLEGGDDEEGGEEGEEGGEEGEEGLEDRVVDLEDALDELKAEFEKLMAGEEGEEEHADMFGGDEGGDEEGGEEPEEESFAFEGSDEEDEEVEESRKPQTAGEQMREYVEKVTAKMGDNGQNTKSAVAGKNDMGGTSANIAKNADGGKGGTQGGLLNPSSKEENAGNVNVPGGKAAKLSAVSKGHGAEKKGAGEQAANKKSLTGSK